MIHQTWQGHSSNTWVDILVFTNNNKKKRKRKTKLGFKTKIDRKKNEKNKTTTAAKMNESRSHLKSKRITPTTIFCNLKKQHFFRMDVKFAQ